MIWTEFDGILLLGEFPVLTTHTESTAMMPDSTTAIATTLITTGNILLAVASQSSKVGVKGDHPEINASIREQTF